VFNGQVTAKRLDPPEELVPKAVRVAVLVNPANAVIAEAALRDAGRRSSQKSLFSAVGIGSRPILK
jgi:hypothetical protein